MTQKTRMLVTLAAALVVAAGAGTYAWFGVFEAEKAEAAQKEADEKLLSLGDVVRLQVRAKGEDTVLEKKDGAWRLVQPVDAPADAATVEALVRQLEGARRSKAVDSTDAARFGLADPAVVVHATDAAGKEADVALGLRNEFDGSIFVRDAAGRIATTSSPLKGALEKSAFELRDKRLVVVGQDAVQGIEVHGANAFTLEKKDGAWQLATPVEERADAPTADGIVRALQDLRATAFVAENPADLAAFGLAQPALRVALRRGGDPAVEVAFGRSGEKVYARSGDGPVAEVPASVLGSIDKAVEELRDKQLFAFATTDVKRVHFAGEGGDMEVEKRGDEWHLVRPKEAKAKRWKLDTIVSLVVGLRADRFVEGKPAEYGLEAPRRTVTLLDGDGKELGRLLVGKTESARAYVQAAGAPRIAQIDSPRLGSLPAGVADLEEPPSATAATND